MHFPSDLKYTKDHEWLKLTENNIAVIGITDFAQDQLGDIVFIDITTVGKQLGAEEIFGTIEAVKTVSDLFLPVPGKIIEVNEALNAHPELVNTDPYDKGWMAKIEVSEISSIEDLLDAEAYEKMVS